MTTRRQHRPAASQTGAVALVLAATVVALVAVVQLQRRQGHDRSRRGLYRVDLEATTAVDPTLLRYRQQGATLPTDWQPAHDLAVDPNGQRLYVAGDRGLLVLAADGRRLRELTEPNGLHAVTVATDGAVWAATQNEVYRADAAGRLAPAWTVAEAQTLLTALVVTENTVVLADAGQRRLLFYGTDGRLRRTVVADPNGFFPGFVVPSPYFDLALGGDGLLRAANPGRLRVDAFTLAGDYEFSWGRPANSLDGFCGCCNPVSLAVLPDGRFVTAEKGLMRVKVYDSDGGFQAVVARPQDLSLSVEPVICLSPEQCQSHALAVAADGQGRVYVLTTPEGVLSRWIPRSIEETP